MIRIARTITLLTLSAVSLLRGSLVRDGVFDEADAMRAGQAVSRDHARRLCGQ